VQVAEQMADYLTTGAVRNAINMPSISAEEAPRLTPFVRLAEQLGSFAGQLTEGGATAIRIEYEGAVAEMNTRALTAAALAGFLQPQLQTVNMVSAPAYAKERGIRVEETRREQHGAYETYIRLTTVTQSQDRSVAGTVFSDGKPRIIQIKGINMEAELAPACSTSPTTTSRASSAGSARPWAMPASTSRGCSSAATSRAATPSLSYLSISRSRRRFLRRFRQSPT
jgi:D-3-phosphoglycerate dehydrogenase